ncbi:MAG TPA: glycosyltransferase family 39 protein [Acidimicrobiales bacterium]
MTAPAEGRTRPAADAGERPASVRTVWWRDVGGDDEVEELGPWSRLVPPLAVAVVVVGIALRLYSRSQLWLDEALTVNIARLGPGAMVDALRHDGHPPLYYLLLHGWMKVFGDGNVAVRSLSAVFGIACLPLAYVVARRVGGARAGLATLLILAASPFAIRYSTETRMYSLVMLLVLCGWLAVHACLERPTPLRLVAVAVISGLLALTHYWAFYLLAATSIALVVAWRRRVPGAGKTFLALAAGAVLFLPWLPVFLEQAASTGTPWGRPERPTSIAAISLADWGGGPFAEAQLVGFGILGLLGLALLARAMGRWRVELDFRTVPGVRIEVAVVVGTVLLATLAGYATDSAFASRYTAMIFPLVIVAAGYGLSRLPGRVWLAALAVLLALSSVGAVRNLITQRTQAGTIAAYIQRQGGPGDVVAYCPDQLGPAVSRLLPADFVQQTFPAGADPHFVDWADYAKKQAAGDPTALAKELVERAGRHNVWLVVATGYRTLGTKCEQLSNAIGALRPGLEVVPSGDEFEHAALHQYGPTGG